MNMMSTKGTIADAGYSMAWPDKQDLLNGLRKDGYVVFSAKRFSLAAFSELISQFCEILTFDPARQYASSAIQTVDAGKDPVGLHIENGNTPLTPDIVSFYSAKSARTGSQTTVCDGISVLADMPAELIQRFEQPFTMRRRLPKMIWQRYVASALNIDSVESVTMAMLEQFIASVGGQSFVAFNDESIDYSLEVLAIRNDNLLNQSAFANALMGPSYNYEAPVYTFADGTPIDEPVLAKLRSIGERHTKEIKWRDGDVAIIDNKRVMHGRREITVPLEQRLLYIAMGLGVKTDQLGNDFLSTSAP